jgi:hypothetical protein
MNPNAKDSAQLEREVEAQRQRVESRIGEIRQRLTPGQLVDEALNYTKDGGAHFASNLGHTVTNNPLPAALLGISLVWLMSGQGPRLSMPHDQARSTYREHDYPYVTVSGSMRRISHAADDSGKWYSEWQDTAGKRYTAEANELGHRAGHFMDETGRKIGGFIDEAGHRFRDFQDEAGNRMDDASGWASHTWHDMQHGVSQAMGAIGHQAQQLGGTAQAQMDRTSRMILDAFQNQPLVAGALAFAAGAALGAALPPTKEEDRMVGEFADKVKGEAAEMASDAYEEGKSRAGELYEKGKAGVAKVADEVKNTVERPGRSTELH